MTRHASHRPRHHKSRVRDFLLFAFIAFATVISLSSVAVAAEALSSTR